MFPDLDQYLITSPLLYPQEKQVKTPKVRSMKRFLKGPISWEWLSVASSLPGKALHVAIVIQFLVGINRSSTVVLSQKRLREFGTKRNAAYRGLKALEKAGLVSVTRHRGRNSVVTILNN